MSIHPHIHNFIVSFIHHHAPQWGHHCWVTFCCIFPGGICSRYYKIILYLLTWYDIKHDTKQDQIRKRWKLYHQAPLGQCGPRRRPRLSGGRWLSWWGMTTGPRTPGTASSGQMGLWMDPGAFPGSRTNGARSLKENETCEIAIAISSSHVDSAFVSGVAFKWV